MGLYLIGSVWSVEFVLVCLQVAVGLGMVIFVHELGHFAVAKLCGVKVEKFYLGFDIAGLKIWKFRRGETEYGIGILPLGGYVKMLGQEDNPARLREELERAKARQTADAGSTAASPERTDTSDNPGSATEQSQKPQAEPNQAEPDQADPAADQPIDIKAVERALFDPRSYLAKSVPKRMAIISAGVVMNVIFAYVLAVIAFGVGVEQIACEVGMLLPGDGAWTAGLRPGDRILEVAGQKTHRFRDLRANVSLGDIGHGIPMLIDRSGVGEMEITVHPDRYRELPTIGVISPSTTTLSDNMPAYPGSPAASAEPGFEPGDKVVEINGTPIETNAQLRRELALLRREVLQVTVQRPRADQDGRIDPTQPPQQLSITVARSPMRRMGLVMEMGEITAIQNGSPAAEAGIRVGDRIKQIDGHPPGDPMTLPDRLRRRAGQTIKLTLGRKGKEVIAPVKLRPVDGFEQPMAENSPLSIPGLGIAYRVLPKIHAVVEGTTAAKKGLKPGNEIAEVRVIPPKKDCPAEETSSRECEFELKDTTVEFTGKRARSWPSLLFEIRFAPPGTQVELTLGNQQKVMLDLYPAKDWFNPGRGFAFEPRTFLCRAESASEALSLGWDETVTSMTLVLTVLEKLATQQISPKVLGGPLMIAEAAGRSAYQGTSALLLFLTLLSANLAVINFLPIPVLDGGHFVFLSWEGITRKPPPEGVQLFLSYIGLLLLVSLMVWVIGLDIVRLVSG